MIATVQVDVALRRPPKVDAHLYYIVQVRGRPGNWSAETEAQLFACQWAASRPGVVMPVGSRIVKMED